MSLLFNHKVMSDSLNPIDCSRPRSSSFTISQSLLKFTPIESVMLSNHLILCHPFLFCLQSFPASRPFPMSWSITSGGQSIGASTSVLLMNIQDWFSLRLTGLIYLQSKELSRVISSTTIWKHLFFSTQPSLWSNCHICIWLLEKLQLWLYRTLLTKFVIAYLQRSIF